MPNGYSPQLLYFDLRLLQPEAHLHLAIHGGGGREVPSRLVSLVRSGHPLPVAGEGLGVRAGAQLAEAEVTVRINSVPTID